MGERIVGTGTLLRHRAKIDEKLATRDSLDFETFKQIHSSCEIEIGDVGLVLAGYNPTHEVNAYHPKIKAHCSKHNVDSLVFVDTSVITY